MKIQHRIKIVWLKLYNKYSSCNGYITIHYRPDMVAMQAVPY